MKRLLSLITLLILPLVADTNTLTLPILPDTPMERAMKFAKGHQEFKNLYFKEHEKEFVRLVKEGQSPQILFIGCSDSRVVPDLILGTRPGDLFVVRTAGNFVPPYSDASSGDGVAGTVEYAVSVLGIKDIIVCGHSHCGAINGLYKNIDDPNLAILKKWLRFGNQAKKLVQDSLPASTPPEERDDVTGKVSVIYQLDHLLSFPSVKTKVEDGSLYLHGWYYVIETGSVEYFDPETQQFKPISF